MSRNALRRIEAINRASRDIMAGDISRRVPLSGSGDELDRLAENLNAMLAQLEQLMTAMREVTDNKAHALRSPLSSLRRRLEVTLIRPTSVDIHGKALRGTQANGLDERWNAMCARCGQLIAGMRQVTDNIGHERRSRLSRLGSGREVSWMLPPAVDIYVEGQRATIVEAEHLLNTVTALLDIAGAEAGAERQAMTP